ISKETNEGLYKARITGVEQATGKYIAFVDSDDTIAIDWFRLLAKEAETNDSDIVIGNTVSIDEANWKYTFNAFASFTKVNKELVSENVADAFFEQGGSCYFWHTMWNKIYTKKLWNKALPYLKKLDKHIIMVEDIAFSTVLYSFAQKVNFIDEDCYFYYRHKEASTGDIFSEEKVTKNIESIADVFDFLATFLKTTKASKKRIVQFKVFKDRYFRMWSNLALDKFAKNSDMANLLKERFAQKKLTKILALDNFYYECKTEWRPEYENMKAYIAEKEHKIISFDIFDTLLIREVWNPNDTFNIMEVSANKIMGLNGENNFYQMRLAAEEVARRILGGVAEDISLTDIYKQFGVMFSFSDDIVHELQALEISTELANIKVRHYGRELLEFTKAIGKKVILVSDMYLEEETVKAMLTKVGIDEDMYDSFYLSSTENLLKATGSLFEYVLKCEEIKPKEMLHIGDTWGIDIEKAAALGIKTAFLPKANEVIENKIQTTYAGNIKMNFENRGVSIVDNSVMLKELSVRSMFKQLANKFYDNPYRPINRISDFNGDPYMLGYNAVGSFTFSLSHWVVETAIKQNKKKIVFLARDGYLVKKVTDIIIEQRGLDIQTEYFYTSRKALLPYMAETEKDFYNLSSYVEISAHTPKSLLALLKDVTKPLTKEIENLYKRQYISLDKKFTSQEKYINFIKTMLNVSFDKDSYYAKLSSLKQLFGQIFTDDSLTFDIGYSGKLLAIINRLSGTQIDGCYVHSSSGAEKIANTSNFNIFTYLDYTPKVSGIVIEYFLSETCGSCVGYDIESGELIPRCEKKRTTYDDDYPVLILQQGALDFCTDYINAIRENIADLAIKPAHFNAILFDYLASCREFDSYIFLHTKLEDEVYGRKQEIPFLEMWAYYKRVNTTIPQAVAATQDAVSNQELYVYNKGYFDDLPRWKRAIFMFFFDHKMFKTKYKQWKSKK
ncbi:MAG: glycosyltransferase, partial [Bacillota bacterium]